MSRAVIIDCDPGTDDAIALFLAFASSELDVRLVTVAGGNVGLDRTLPNACALVGLAGDHGCCGAGADRPLVGSFRSASYVHGADGIGGVLLPPGVTPTPGIAADAIRAVLRAAGPAEITLVGIGPATNLALALATEPALIDRIAEIVLMTGAWAEGNVTPAAEFNAWSDPEALAIVLAAGCPITLATLELTSQAIATPERLATLRARPGGACLSAAVDIMSSVPPSVRVNKAGCLQHDACAVMWLVAPALFTHRPVHAGMDLGPGPGRGRTVIDRWGRLGLAPNARLLDTLDARAFFTTLGERIATLP
jgi:inosine-uridine nucleoside N-ribohydrolase